MKSPLHRFRLVLMWVALSIVATSAAWGQHRPVIDVDAGLIYRPKPRKPFTPLPYSEIDQNEKRQILYLLEEAKLWHYRVFGLMRLDRYRDDAIHPIVLDVLKDSDFHVRCFALWAMVRHGIELPEGALDQEKDPRVVRTAILMGFKLEPRTVSLVAGRAMRSRDIGEVLIGLDIAAMSDDEALRRSALRRIKQLVVRMNKSQHVIASQRIAGLIGWPQVPTDPRKWQEQIQVMGNISLATLPDRRATYQNQLAPWIAAISAEKFSELINYLDTLAKTNIDLTVAMDGTGSMRNAIEKAQAEVDRLVLVLNDLSQKMRFGFCAYRDTTDADVVEPHPLTDSTARIRTFLLRITAHGGNRSPEESILSGLRACLKLGWSDEAEKHLVIVGDMPSHAAELPDITKLIEDEYKYNRIKIHAVAIYPAVMTHRNYKTITDTGGGEHVVLNGSTDLTKHIMRFTIEERVRPAFDDFFDLYNAFTF